MLTPSPVRIAHRDRIAAACRRLSLSPQAVTPGETAQPGPEAFLLTVWEDEVAHRETQRRTRLLSRAGFPVRKTLAAADRHRVPRPSTLTGRDLEPGAFIDAHRNLGLYGAVGTGQSPRATALGVQACEPGRAVCCFPGTDRVRRWSAARRAGTVDRRFQEVQRAAWLILDEGGYVPGDREGAQLLFRIIADR